MQYNFFKFYYFQIFIKKILLFTKYKDSRCPIPQASGCNIFKINCGILLSVHSFMAGIAVPYSFLYYLAMEFQFNIIKPSKLAN